MNKQSQISTLRWSELTDLDKHAWDRFRATRPSLRSPFFSWDWIAHVNAVRNDISVLRVMQNGSPVAYLPIQTNAFGWARPVGSPLCDWQGFISCENFKVDTDLLLTHLGVAGFKFSTVPPDDPLFQSIRGLVDASFALDLSAGYPAYATAQIAARPKAFRNYRSRLRRLAEAHPFYEVRLDDRDPAAFDEIIRLKSEQYRDTGQPNALRPAWTIKLLANLFSGDRADLHARISTLRVNGRIIAGHLGLQERGHLHYWFPVYDHKFADFSPGIVLLHEIAKAEGEHAVSTIDLGGGSYRFKEEFANSVLPFKSIRLARWGGRRIQPSLAHRAFPQARKLTRRIELFADMYTLRTLKGGGPAAARIPSTY